LRAAGAAPRDHPAGCLMRILVTNDDGIESPGLQALASAARAAGHEVVVYAVPAAPAYIVILSTLGVFGPSPDLVLSGVNPGANAGRAVLHSGTVGAALTAVARGLHGMAVSLDYLAAVDGSTL